MRFTVYKTTNLINGMYYHGYHEQKNPNDGYYGSGTHLKRAIKKYGKDNFVVETLHRYGTKEEAFAKEIELVNASDPMSYNIADGGLGGCSGHSEETKEKIRQSNLGKKRSEETKRRVGLASKGRGKGRVVSEETRKRLSKSLKGMGLGIPLSDETKRKMSITRTGKTCSEETKKKIGAANRIHMTGRKHSEETKRKMRLAAKKRKENNK